jgi:hemin uptake protein HemP
MTQKIGHIIYAKENSMNNCLEIHKSQNEYKGKCKFTLLHKGQIQVLRATNQNKDAFHT